MRSFNFLYRQSLQKGKRNFGNWFVQILYFHQRSGFPLLFVYFSLSVSTRSACFINRRRQSGGTGFAGLRSKPSMARQEVQRDPSPTLLVFFSRKANFLAFSPSPQAKKLRTIKNTLRFELHFRLCFGKADAADNLRLELLRGFRDSSRIAFLCTFFLKKKVHKVLSVRKTRFLKKTM